MKKRHVILLLVFSLLFMLACPLVQATETPEEEIIMVLEVKEEVEPGLSAYLERNFKLAEERQATGIILLMDTPGGRVDAAQEIKRLIYDCEIPVTVLIEDQAISAGAYIALACDNIAMMPGSTIGDAEMRINGVMADEKYLSAWREEFAALAEDKGRNPEIARAFVDRDIVIPDVVESGKLLTLTPQRAVELGMADYLAADLEELLTILGCQEADLLYGEITGGEKLTRMITGSTVAPILLGLGLMLVIIELLSPGLGIPGIAGAALLVLYFGGHMLAGMASWIAILLFIIGLILCIIEIFMPGIGIFAVGGLGCIVGSIFLTTPDTATAIKYLVIVLLVMLIMAPILLKLFSKSKMMDKLLVKETLSTEKGYTARKEKLETYIGQEGIALTTLRPAGTVELANGERLDVVTKGEFVTKGESIKIVGIDGTWLIAEKGR